MPTSQNLRAQERSQSRSPSTGPYILEEGVLLSACGNASPISGSNMQDDDMQLSGRMWRLPGILGKSLSQLCSRGFH